MVCPLCQKRPAKRSCPALGQEICTVCCATKRLVEIQCTENCRYLSAGQRHPAAVVKRQLDRDVTMLMATVGRLSEQQLQLFFLLQSMVLSTKPEGLSRITDADVALATEALASSLETASKGLIFEKPLRHRCPRKDCAGRLSQSSRRLRRTADLRRNARWPSSSARWNGARNTRVVTSRTARRPISDLVGRVFQQKPQPDKATSLGSAAKPRILLP